MRIKLDIYVLINIWSVPLHRWISSPRGYHPPSSHYFGTDMVY